VVEEKKAMASIIKAAREEQGDKRDVKRVARKLLNICSKNRVISKQEAVCQLIGLPLYTCSEILEPVSLAGNIRLGTEFQAKRTFLSRYVNREKTADVENMSLDQYFHHCYNKTGDRSNSRNFEKSKTRIPIYSGASCEAVYPITPAYARGIMLIHSPWRDTKKLDKDSEELLEEFEKFVTDKSRCPESVSVAYDRARLALGMIEPTSKVEVIDYNNFSVLPDQDIIDLVDLANGIYSNLDEEDHDSDAWNYDYGEDHDWSTRKVEVGPPKCCVFSF
jgi:hypothetical protein